MTMRFIAHALPCTALPLQSNAFWTPVQTRAPFANDRFPRNMH